MKTDELIRAMAADTRPERSFAQLLPLALLACVVAGVPFFSATMGLRADWPGSMASGPALLKQLFPVVAGLAAFGAAARLTRPEASLGRWTWALLGAPAIMLVAFAVAAARTPVADWPVAIRGDTAANCFLSVSIIGLLTLACAFAALRRGASVRPRLSGALAGLLAGSVSAALYASFCAEDNPMFWVIWYGGAIATVTAFGVWLGPRQLRW